MPEAAVVGEGWEAREVRRQPRLQFRIVDERVAGFVGFGKVKVGGRDRLYAVGTEQVGDLSYLAGIVAGDDELAGLGAAAHRPVALSFAAETPFRPMRGGRWEE